MSNKCKYCDFVGTNDEMEKHAGEMCWERQIDAVVSPAIYTAMWSNQPVNVCEKHAQQIINVGSVIGLKVPLIRYFGDEECINCNNEANQG